MFSTKIRAKWLIALMFTVVTLMPGTVAHSEVGRENLLEAEKQINVASYRPNYPEIQLGYAAKLAVNEAGVVYMDTEAIQGNINSKGQLYIDAVKGEGDVYFVIEKGGYVLSILARDNKIVSDAGEVVQINLVDWLYGRNGLADEDGFKSNLVPKGFLPKTGLEEDEAVTHHLEFQLSLMDLVLILLTAAAVVVYGIVRSKERAREVDMT